MCLPALWVAEPSHRMTWAFHEQLAVGWLVCCLPSLQKKQNRPTPRPCELTQSWQINRKWGTSIECRKNNFLPGIPFREGNCTVLSFYRKKYLYFLLTWRLTPQALKVHMVSTKTGLLVLWELQWGFAGTQKHIKQGGQPGPLYEV